MSGTRTRRRTVLVLLRRVGIVLAFLAVLARPGWGEATAPRQVADLEVLVVVDRTRSMAALDHDGDRPRVDGARADLRRLVEELPSARYALLTYGFDVQVELPFTEDTAAFTAAVDTLRLETPTGGIGSALQRPREEILEVLGNARDQHPERRRLIVFVSDGERTTDAVGGSMTDIAGLVGGGVVLGYGTTEGARMPAEPSDEEAFVQDPATGRDAVSRADPEALRALGDDLGVPFLARTPATAEDRSATPGALAELAAEWERDATTVAAGSGDERAAHDLTWVAGLVLLVLVVGELLAGWRALWTSRTVLAGGRRTPGAGAP